MAKINARKKGHAYELQVRDKFIDIGFTDCQTSRYASREMDDKKIDLCGTGEFQVQCKAVENLGPPHNVIAEMPKGMNILFHKINRKGSVVSMSEETFFKLAKIYVYENLISRREI